MIHHWRRTPTGMIRIIGPELAADPSDGGKWALYCEHLENDEWLNGGLIQDDNRRRLASHCKETRDYNYTEWCPLCQDQHAQHHATLPDSARGNRSVS